MVEPPDRRSLGPRITTHQAVGQHLFGFHLREKSTFIVRFRGYLLKQLSDPDSHRGIAWGEKGRKRNWFS